MIEHRHFALHKPYGYVSQFVSNEKKGYKAKKLGLLYDFPDGTMAIGRLDKDSEGLLLLTTDGKVSAEITSRKVEKEYYVQLDGDIDSNAMLQLQKGIEISIRGDKYMTKPCVAHLLKEAPLFPPRIKKIRDDRHGPTSWVSITVKEGKFRQVRKMTAAVGFPTLRLVRVRVGDISLGQMKSGEVLELQKIYTEK